MITATNLPAMRPPLFRSDPPSHSAIRGSRFKVQSSRFLLLFAVICLWATIVAASAAIPSPEKLLPDDTLIVVTVPDFAKLREMYRKSPQRQLWNDPAMKPFKDKFISKWQEEFVKPLERELNVSLDSYASLPQGQLTFALLQNAGPPSDEQSLGWLLLLDTKDKSAQLKTNLADLRKKWVDAGKTVKTEKIRDFEFAVVPMSSNDVPKALRKLFPQPSEVQELPVEGETKKAAPKNDLVIGQADSLLILGNSIKAVEKIVIRLSGGSLPSLAELAAYESNHRVFFRDSPVYAWANVKAFIDLNRKSANKKESDAPDPFATMKPDKVLTAIGLAGLKTIAIHFQDSSEGSLIQVFLGVPEASRQGIFKILAGEPKECAPPQFVPADALKFRRWRLDGQKAWAALEKMLAEISPQSLNGMNFLLDTANTAAKEKDPSFDIRKNLIGNLGDDIITYEKAARGSTLAELSSPPSLYLVGSPHPEQLAAALKSILVFMSQQAGTPGEREFLGRKIFSVTLPAMPLPMGGSSRPGAARILSYSASGGYVVISTDASLLEEYLRSSESKAKALREISGLVEATQKVTDPGTGLLGYENSTETMRAAFEKWKKDPNPGTNSTASTLLPGALGMAGPERNLKEWMDFSLLPAYDRVARYFHFNVYAGSANVDGLSFKLFSPLPPALKAAQGSSSAR